MKEIQQTVNSDSLLYGLSHQNSAGNFDEMDSKYLTFGQTTSFLVFRLPMWYR